MRQTSGTSSSVLQRLQAEYGEVLESALRARLGEAGRGAFPGMMQYALGFVDENLRPVQAPSGKRFRPLLCLLACRAAGGSWQEALPVAVAIELVHNFSLIHDDVEDNDPTRRHRPAVWAVWGKPQAINAGDGLFAIAFRTVMDLASPPGVIAQIAAALADVAYRLTEGQYLDMSFEKRGDVTVDEYLDMISLKSAALIAFSAWCGAVLAGAPPETQSALQTFGLHAGRAFQIHDDILGIWAAPDLTGKEVVRDLKNHKKTLPVLLAAECATGSDLLLLRRYLAGEDGDVEEVVRILNATDARARSMERISRHLKAARSALQGVQLAASDVDELIGLSGELTGQ